MDDALLSQCRATDENLPQDIQRFLLCEDAFLLDVISQGASRAFFCDDIAKVIVCYDVQ